MSQRHLNLHPLLPPPYLSIIYITKIVLGVLGCFFFYVVWCGLGFFLGGLRCFGWFGVIRWTQSARHLFIDELKALVGCINEEELQALILDPPWLTSTRPEQLVT